VYEYLKEKGYQVFLPQNECKEKQGKDVYQCDRGIRILLRERTRSRVGVWKNPNAIKPSEFRKRAKEK
jgi:hypothetical protein